ncbi:unnamed protein product [Moneuplotes crassus]|uniref:Uncharacterized protein n=1 Tax=Euplotes crassus TaxID=5936 RepID=A0AAD1UAB0_EUPCR|nr:unnamed protein product [Moneuplotes crassus]
MIFWKNNKDGSNILRRKGISLLHSLCNFEAKFPTNKPEQRPVKKPNTRRIGKIFRFGDPSVIPITESPKDHGLDIPEVGESLEILLEWYERHIHRPIPHKAQIAKLHEQTNLSKTIIRAWLAKVRKYKLVIVRSDDGKSYLGRDPRVKPRTYIKSMKYCKVKRSRQESCNTPTSACGGISNDETSQLESQPSGQNAKT